MQAEDFDQIVEITRQSPGAAPWTKEMFSNLKGHAEKVWVAERGSRLTGFLVVRIVTDEAEILNLAVDPAARRKGIAQALLAQTIRELASAGGQSIFLEVRESNVWAIALYARAGFEIFGKRPGYYHDPEEAALCMKRKLLDQDQVPT